MELKNLIDESCQTITISANHSADIVCEMQDIDKAIEQNNQVSEKLTESIRDFVAL